MKVKIKKDGKKETFNLINSWSDVTLEKWSELVALQDGSKSEEALETITALSDIPRMLVSELALNDVVGIMSKIAELQAQANSGLKNIIEIDGIEYGFHPNLEDITLGEYADLETFIQDGVEKNLPEIMSVLYRPITERKGYHYSIQAYDGALRLRAEEMKKMKAEEVQSALVFFWNLGNKLSMILPSYLMERTQAILKTLQTTSSQKNGVGSV